MEHYFVKRTRKNCSNPIEFKEYHNDYSCVNCNTLKCMCVPGRISYWLHDGTEDEGDISCAEAMMRDVLT